MDHKDYKLKGKVHAPFSPFRGKGLRRTISFNLSFEM